MFKSRTKRAALAASAALAATTIALAGCAGGTPEPESTFDPDEEVTLNFTWWGNDDRAARYGSLIEKFNEQFPNITINGTFTDFPKAIGRGARPRRPAADCRTCGNSPTPTCASTQSRVCSSTSTPSRSTSTSTPSTKHCRAPASFRVRRSLPTGYSAWSVFQNNELLDANGLDPYEGGTTWAEYSAYMAAVTDTTGGALYG